MGTWSRRGVIAGFVGLLVLAAGGAPAGAGGLATDQVVRDQMIGIRKLTLDVHTLVTHRRMPPADARTYHQRIKTAVERIAAETTLTGEAREEIDGIARDILGGAAAVAGLDAAQTPIDGIVAVDEALTRYGKRFDHPDWKPLR